MADSDPVLRVIQVPRTWVPTSCKFKATTWESLKALSLRTGRSKAELIREAVDQYVERES